MVGTVLTFSTLCQNDNDVMDSLSIILDRSTILKRIAIMIEVLLKHSIEMIKVRTVPEVRQKGENLSGRTDS